MKKYQIVFIEDGKQKEELIEAHNIINCSNVFIPMHPKAEVLTVKEVSKE